MEMPAEIEQHTNDFFDMHWPNTGSRPAWICWKLQGKPENGSDGGCYAVFNKNRLLYIGLALTRGKRHAEGGPAIGLYNRLRRHVVRPRTRGSDEYVYKLDKFKDMTHIKIIPFPNDRRYLAAALEAYLIEQNKPPLNWPYSVIEPIE